ncbi:MAG: Sodium:sulfate symporter transmembrane region [Methanoregula sp. PtaU1.Bin051]|nr:MAG: Sodium:sulfate symporter transmembrane region [Methanoregula sp. PtaU1.Bin051]
MLREAGLIAGIILFIVTALAPANETVIPAPVRMALAVTVLVVVWWITEAIPLSATALLPLILLPLLNVVSFSEAATPYADPIIFLFLGGFIIAAGMQRWSLHRRIALEIIRYTGTSPRRLVLGFMVATAFLSMWISNTASTMMMIPMAVAIIATLAKESSDGKDSPGLLQFRSCLVLAVAYAATIGGIGTIIGTPPNGIFIAQVHALFPGAPRIDFFQWLLFGIPFAALFLLLAWIWLTRVAFRSMPQDIPGATPIISGERSALGKLSRGELWTLLVFCCTAACWILADPKNIGDFVIPGIRTFLPGVSDSVIAVGGALLLFILPVDRKAGIFAMDWQTAVSIPWDILIIFGGGLSLSAALVKTGAANLIVQLFGGLAGLPFLLIAVILCIVLIMMGELMSNTANASIMVPLMAVLGVAIGVNPVLLMLLSSLVAALGFMLPVSTPPNAIAFGTGFVTMNEMMRTGVVLNLMGIVLIIIALYTLIPWAFGFTPGITSWAVLP